MTEVFIAKQQDKLKLIEVLKATEMPYKVKISKGKRRSVAQNAYLFGVCYQAFLDHGLQEQGFTLDDIHHWFLEEYFGCYEVELFGRKKTKPVRTTTTDMHGNPDTLQTVKFMDYIDFVQQKGAERGIVIEDPQ